MRRLFVLGLLVFASFVFAQSNSGNQNFAAVRKLLGTTESFLESPFCVKYGCTFVARNDVYFGIDTLFDYTLNSKFENVRIQIQIVRRVDVLQEARLIIKTARFLDSDKKRTVAAEFIGQLTGQIPSMLRIKDACGESLIDVSKRNFYFVQSGVTCERYYGPFFNLRISLECYPELLVPKSRLFDFQKTFILQSNNWFLPEKRDFDIPDAHSVEFFQKGNELSKGIISAFPLYPFAFQPSVGFSLQNLRQIIAKPPKEPRGIYALNNFGATVQRLTGKERIYLQSNFKSILTPTLKGIRMIEFIARDEQVGDYLPQKSIFRYVFLGFTRDGKYYIRFEMDCAANFLPEALPQLDPDTPEQQTRDAFIFIENKLNTTPDKDFTPKLNSIDALVGSISVFSP
jgi:hypothetical protein